MAGDLWGRPFVCWHLSIFFDKDWDYYRRSRSGRTDQALAFHHRHTFAFDCLKQTLGGCPVYKFAAIGRRTQRYLTSFLDQLELFGPKEVVQGNLLELRNFHVNDFYIPKCFGIPLLHIKSVCSQRVSAQIVSARIGARR